MKKNQSFIKYIQIAFKDSVDGLQHLLVLIYKY